MKYIATIRPTDTREIEIDEDTYEAAHAAAVASVPEGFQLIAFRRTDG